MRHVLLLSLTGTILVAACGGTPEAGRTGTQPAVDRAAAGEPKQETRWLRGLWASDIRKALPAENIKCEGPHQEGQELAWKCQWGTPLVSYKVLFYGAAPGKIEYLKATVAQSNQPKDSLTLPLFTTLAGLRFEGSEPDKARAWVQKTLADGGQTDFGAARFKLSGDVTRRAFELKATGSDW